MMLTILAKRVLILTIVVLMAACESRTSGSLGYVEPDTPDAQPCGEGCPEGQTCVPNLDVDGVAEFICLDNAVAYCAPCSNDDDCYDDRLLNINPVCVPSLDGSGSYCATPCSTDNECPSGAHCELFSDGSSACLPDDGGCECSEWATERGAITECSISNAEGSCSGERSCGIDGLSACSDQVPTAELCDGIDNNCDGAVDDTYPEYGLDCDGADEDFCSGGTYFCVEGALVCSDDEASILEACNAQDDDCDGLVDEDLTTRVIADAQGVCRGSEETCEGALGWVSPDFTLLEGYEVDEATCDGLDNDCDGETDESFTRDEGYIWATLDGVEDLFVGDECGVGICAGGTVQCNEDGDGLECSTSDRAVEEVCDGLDNDCDGEVDDGMAAPLADEQRGVCAGVTKICDGTGDWAEPDYASLSDYEEVELTCDGLDNDCDGEVDEGLSAPDADLLLGVCVGAKKVCNGEAGWEEPNYSQHSEDYQIEEMWCDNLDNDCDGETDELFLDGGLINYTDLNGTQGLWKGDTCGVGACGGGIVLCNDAKTGLTCSTLGSVSGETCNGADDDCNGTIDNGFNLSTDEANCGACGVTCTNAHGNTQCADGVCIPSCDPLWGDCSNPNDGCETQLTTVDNCGGCGVVCDLPNAIELCTENGVCGIAACEPGWSDCDGIASNGCESYLAGDVNNCGGCGKTCVNEHGEAACISGLCVANCDPGWASCDGSNSNGCETPLNTLTDCNGCGITCGAPNADATCADYACAITQCDFGFEDCNGNLSDGCEINYLADVNNCNGCGVVCDPANAAGVCNNGSCAIAACDNRRCDLDGNVGNGCEVNLNSNPSCGGSNMETLQSISGDVAGPARTVSGYRGEQWFKIRATEDSNLINGFGVTVTLFVPDGTDYDLEVFKGGCSSDKKSSSNGVGETETTRHTWSDNWFGSDDSEDFYIFVKAKTVNVCDTWSLTIQGNTD